MLLSVSLPGVSTVYVAPFVGADWNLAARTAPPDSQAPPSPDPSTEAALCADLMSESPEYDTIDLPAGATIVVTQPLEITHSVTIVGNGATLYFQQGQTAAWPASASGAIYVDTPTYDNIQLTLENFTIEFDPSEPIRWNNPPDSGPALFDPENNPAGVEHAVIDTRDSNTNLNITILSLNNMSIYGPPAFDGSTFSSLQAELEQQWGTEYVYAGEQDIDLVRTNDQDSGTISGSTFQGGPIEVFNGPWTIVGNTILGSTDETYSPGAFGLHTPHDVLIEGNSVSQVDANGREFRLVVLSLGGYDNTILDNSFGGGAGQIGNEVSYWVATNQFGGINSPEVILPESGYGVVFEGRPAAISADGLLLVLTNLRATAFPISTGPGLVVSILGGVSASGAPDMSTAGEWFPVAEQVSLTSDGTIELLMRSPLPPMPPGGYYIVEVTGGFVNTTIEDNTIDLKGKSSTGVVLNGEDFGTTIADNLFIGGTTYDNVYTGTAISVTSTLDSAASGTGAFPLPAGWTALADLGTVITGNTIRDSLGGIILGVQHDINYWEGLVGGEPETGRVFLTATVTGNKFEFDTSFLTSWASSYVADGNDPAQSSVPPTITVGAGFSAEARGHTAARDFPGPWATPSP